MAADPEHAGLRRPRVLVTGFGPFPGAVENPTEALIARLAALPDLALGIEELRLEVLPVEYAAIPQRLAALGTNLAPDIAIHFGLSAEASGFELERQAKNAIAEGKPDNAGFLPPERQICGGGDLASALPLAAIFEALRAHGLPVAYSDDAGAYLCNYLFYHSRAHLCAGFAPSMCGFIHVPPLDSGTMTLEDMTAGAAMIVETCKRTWTAPTGAAGSAVASTGSP